MQGLQQLASIHIRLDPPVSGCCGQLASQLGGCFERRCNKSISLVWGGVYSCLQGGWCFRIHKPQASTSIQLGYCCIYNVNVYCFDCSHISCRQVRCESGALNRGINSRIQTCWVETLRCSRLKGDGEPNSLMWAFLQSTFMFLPIHAYV